MCHVRLLKGFSGVLSAAALTVTMLPGSSYADCDVLSTYNSNTDAAVTSSVNGQVDVFSVAANGALFRFYGDPRNLATFAGQNLGGVAGSEPAAVSWGSGHSAVFVRGSNGELWYLQWDNGSATGWQSLGGQVTWNPHVVSTAPGHMIAFYRGTNQELWYRERTSGSWGPHTSLGGILSSSPIAVSWGPGHVAVFVRGQSGDLWYRQRIGSSWGPWTGLGGTSSIDPMVVSRGAGLIDIFVRTGSAVSKRSYNGSWGSWSSLGAPPSGAVSEPSAAVTSSGDLVAFVRGGTVGTAGGIRPIYQRTSSDGGVTWSGWTTALVAGGYPSANNPEAVGDEYGGWIVAATNYPSGAQVGQLYVCTSH